MITRIGQHRTAEEWCGLLFGGCPRRILFRVDAGCIPGLSFGHLYRCLSVARRALDTGTETVIFLMRDHPDGVGVAEQVGMLVVPMPVGITSDDEASLITGLVSETAAEWIVVDLPYDDQDFSWQGPLRAGGTRVLFVDDARFRVPEADVVWNSSILAPGKLYSAEPTARILAGMDYFIFDRDGESVPLARTEGKINVLIAFGGSDPTGFILRVVGTLLTRPWPDCRFRVVLGPGYREGRQVQDTLEERGNDWEIVENPPSLMPYLDGSDIAVCNGGRTLYELACLGRTALPIASTAYEATTVAAFLNHEIVPSGLAEWDRGAFLEDFTNLVQSTRAVH
jgi:spore coat polysaccharide biosynthesis predicted glycosyltransferase SpsG